MQTTVRLRSVFVSASVTTPESFRNQIQQRTTFNLALQDDLFDDMKIKTSGVATGAECPLDSEKIAKIEKKREKIRKKGKKEEKSGKFFHFAPPDR